MLFRSGAGVGGIAGWIKGNKVKEEYQENVEEMQKEAEKARKVFEATGLSIEDVTFRSKALTQAMNDSEVSAEQFALMFQEECVNVAKEAFGDISLSLKEVKKLASEISFAGMAEELSDFAQATADAETALNRLQSSVTGLKKENWKVGLGMELSETDKDGYKSAIENFLSTSQAFIDDNHYQATVALKLLAGGEADTTGLDSNYGQLKSQIEDLGAELANSMNIALEDSVITLDEAAELESLQEQISAITYKLTEAKTGAELQALKLKYTGAELDMESFYALQEELQANVTSASEQYESALTLTLTNLNLQLADGAITQAEYDEAVAEATEGYYAQINELNARVSTFNLESIAAAWNDKLSDIMPEIEGTTAEKLSEALNKALLVHPDVKAWTTTDVISWVGLDKLDLDTPERNTIAEELIQTALAVPEGTKETIIQEFKDQVPTVEEIKEAINWDSLTNNQLNELLKDAGAVIVDGGTQQIEMPLSDWAEMWGKNYEEYIDQQAELIRSSLENSMSEENLSSFMQQHMTKTESRQYEFLLSQFRETGMSCGNALNDGVSLSLLSGSELFRSDLQTALDTTTEMPFTIYPAVNVKPYYYVMDVNLPTFGQGQDAEGHAAGGYVSGGPQLSWLAEEGYGEFVIPTNPSRRARALDLYEQAGAALGVSAHAAGGYVGDSVSGISSTGYDLFKDVNRNAPIAYNETTGGKNVGETAWTYEPVPTERESSSGGSPVQVKVELSPEFVIHGGDGQSEEGIMNVIRRHIKEMADELGGEIAGKLEEVFSNMPLKEA